MLSLLMIEWVGGLGGSVCIWKFKITARFMAISWNLPADRRKIPEYG
jgi:hypothetical protein